jgi:hypothetical protein
LDRDGIRRNYTLNQNLSQNSIVLTVLDNPGQLPIIFYFNRNSIVLALRGLVYVSHLPPFDVGKNVGISLVKCGLSVISRDVPERG